MKTKIKQIAVALLDRIKQIAIAFDQLINTFFPGGWADETFSARCWRQRRSKGWGVARLVIDSILFFDKNHCQTSYASEVLRLQSPPESRQQNLPEQ